MSRFVWYVSTRVSNRQCHGIYSAFFLGRQLVMSRLVSCASTWVSSRRCVACIRLFSDVPVAFTLFPGEEGGGYGH